MTVADQKAAKKAANIAAHQRRTEQLKENQRLAASLRSQGYFGTDDAILRQYHLKQQKIQEAEQAAIKQAQYDLVNLLRKEIDKIESVYIQESLKGPSGQILKKWLANRIPTYDLIARFFNERPNLQQFLARVA